MSFPSKRPIRLGDRTTHGGTVTSASSHLTINGVKVAVLGDTVSCPRCGSSTTITQGDPAWHSGSNVALHNHSTSCGATLISSLTA